MKPLQIAGIVVMMISLCRLFPQSVTADESDWSEPQNISASSFPSRSPFVVVDLNEQPHFFWAETTDDNPSLDTVFYRTLQGDKLTPPIDIFAVPFSNRLDIAAARLDRFGRVVVVWFGSSGIQFSRVHPSEAASPLAWKTTALAINERINDVDLFIDERGTYHLAYIRNERELVYASSTDLELWEHESSVAYVDAEEEAIGLVSIAASADTDTVAVTFTHYEKEANWGQTGVSVAVQMKRLQWSDPHRLATETGLGQSELLIDRTGQIHTLWNGNLSIGGRYLATSPDGGTTWLPTETIMPDTYRGNVLSGSLLEDSEGGLHVVVGGRLDSEQVWYLSKTNQKWSAPQSLTASFADSEASYTTLHAGQELHVVWHEYQSDDIWYTMRQLPTARIVPSTVSEPEPEPEPAIEPMPTQPVTPTSAVPENTTREANGGKSERVGINRDTRLSALILSTLSSLLLIAVAGFVARKR